MDGQTLGGGVAGNAGTGGSPASTSGGAGASTLAGSSTQTAAGANAAGAPAIGGSASAGPPAMCSSFSDDTAWKLSVHIKNEKSTPIYLGSEQMAGCASERLFQVADGSRAVLPLLDSCRSSCTTVMAGGTAVCANACAAPSTVTLAPGQTIDLPWDGLYDVDTTVPSECMHTAVPGPTACVRAQKIKNGLFTFTALAGAERQCLTPGACSTCTPTSSGGCSTPGSLMAGTITTTNFIIALDPGESVVGADPQYIGLVFKDQ